jgi:hypothetical protein
MRNGTEFLFGDVIERKKASEENLRWRVQ